MARRKRRSAPPAKRDLSRIASSLVELYLRPIQPIRSTLSQIEDRREWHPDRHRPASSLSRPRHRLIALGAQRPTRARGVRPGLDVRAVPARIGFQGARRVLICIRRRERREALFASAKAGRGSGRRGARKRRNAYSEVHCA